MTVVKNITFDEYKKDIGEGKSMFKVPYHMAPIDVAIFPLVKKGGLQEKAREIYDNLIKDGYLAVFDSAGSIGKRYQRVAEQGVPYAVTVDFDTLEKEGAPCTIRDRDSEEQKVVPLEKISETLKKLLEGKINFKDL